ncbi:hypothetical protein Tco_1546478 [Tanacetum coccineum]
MKTMMKPTMEEYVNKTRGDYYSGITKTMINGKATYELKGKILDDLRNNAFSGRNGEDAIKHIENILKVIDPLDLPNGDDQEVLTDEAFSYLKETYEDGEYEIAEMFRIKTDIFDFKTPICTAFNEFNYLLNIDTDLFTHDIQRAKTYEEYKNEWFYKLNNDVPWDPEEPWSKTRVPHELIDHICESFCFKNGKTKWSTYSSNEDGFCNGGELSRMVRVGYMTYFKDYKWYDDLIYGNLKEEALKQKAMNERS